MPLNPETLIPVILRAVNKVITEDYARSALGRQQQAFTVRKKELVDAFRESYVYIYNEEVENQKNSGEKIKSTRWPDPTPGTKSGKILEKGFIAAADAAMEYFKSVLSSNKKNSINKYIPDVPQTKAKIRFLQRYASRDIFVKAKTAGLKVLSTYIKNAGGKEISFYSDLRKAELDTAGAEDRKFRALLHRTHAMESTTGLATISARIQALNLLAGDGFFGAFKGKKEPSMTSLVGRLESNFEVTPDAKGMIDIKAGRINLTFGSFVWNLTGPREADLSNIKKEFEKSATKALKANAASLNALLGLGDTEAEIESKIGQMIQDKLTAVPSAKAKKSIQKRKAKRKTVKGPDIQQDSKEGKPTKIDQSPISQTELNEFNDDQLRRANRLKVLLGRFITSTIARKMNRPRLEYQTGRFAHTVEIRDVKIKDDDTASVEFAYMENPYRVFEDGPAKWATPERNPRKLIESSIREILKAEGELLSSTRRGEEVATQPRWAKLR